MTVRIPLLILALVALLPEAGAQMRLTETGAPNTKYVGFQAPSSVSTSFEWILPGADGGANQCLATDGNGQLIWRTAGGTGYSLDAVDGSPTNAVYVNSSGSVGIGTTNPQAKLDIAGAVKVANDTGTCDATKGGAIRYTASAMEFCNGTAWTDFNPPGTHCGARNVHCNGTTITYDAGSASATPCKGSALTATCSGSQPSTITGCPTGYTGKHYQTGINVNYVYLIMCVKN